MKPSEAIKLIERARFGEFPYSVLTIEAFDLAISALEKQEQDNNKSCDTCKHKNLPVSKFPCDECYFASDFEDYYEPYTEEES